jgi:hypothetical protein
VSDTFWVDDTVLVTRDGVVGVDAEEQWTWSWTRPSLPDTEHLVRYLPRPTGRWLRGIRVAPGGWSDMPMFYVPEGEDEPQPWPVPRDRDQAEEWVTDLIHREPK